MAYRNPSNAFKISTHAPARGATAIVDPPYFSGPISTHAPARGATKDRCITGQSRSISTHAPARGATLMESCMISPGQFQPTLPRGERLEIKRVCLPIHDFNPRSREGSDDLIIFSEVMFDISTHAPARGATLYFLCL